MRLVQILNEDGEQLGLVETDLTDSELQKAVDIIDDAFDMFDKFEMYAVNIGRPATCKRVFVEELTIN